MKIRKIDSELLSLKTTSGIYPFQLPIFIYFLDGIMIDAGSSRVLKKIKPFLKKEKIDSVAITHIHEDHTGNAFWIEKNLNIPIFLSSNSIEEAAQKTKLPLYRKLVWGNRNSFKAKPLPKYIETKKYKLEVIPSPGHHPHHVLFYEKNKGWIFTGDLYVSRKQKVAFKDENISEAIETIKNILKLDFDTLFCSHSGVNQKGKEKLKKKLNFFEEIQSKVEELKKKGFSYGKIKKIIFPKPDLWEIISHGEWSTLNIVKTVLPDR